MLEVPFEPVGIENIILKYLKMTGIGYSPKKNPPWFGEDALFFHFCQDLFYKRTTSLWEMDKDEFIGNDHLDYTLSIFVTSAKSGFYVCGSTGKIMYFVHRPIQMRSNWSGRQLYILFICPTAQSHPEMK